MKTLRKAFIIGALLVTAVVALAKTAGVAWDPSPQDTEFGPLSYNVYIYTNDPTASGTTNGAIAIYPTTNTSLRISNLMVGQTYWCNVDCQDTNNLHSDLSQTIAFTYPGAPMMLHVVP